MRGVLFFVALFAPLAEATYACEPIFNERVSEVRSDSADCSAVINYSQDDSAILTPAEDLGSGIVTQMLLDGHFCLSQEVNYVVFDCNSDRAAVFGEDQGPGYIVEIDDDGNIIHPDSDQIFRLVEAAAASGRPLQLSEILSMAREKKLETVVETDADALVAINGRKFKLGCGCRLFYGE